MKVEILTALSDDRYLVFERDTNSFEKSLTLILRSGVTIEFDRNDVNQIVETLKEGKAL